MSDVPGKKGVFPSKKGGPGRPRRNPTNSQHNWLEDGETTLTRMDLEKRVAARLGVTVVLVAKVLRELLSQFYAQLLKGGRVDLRDFGVLYTRDHRGRKCAGPLGRMIDVPPMRVAAFRPHARLRKDLKQLKPRRHACTSESSPPPGATQPPTSPPPSPPCGPPPSPPPAPAA